MASVFKPDVIVAVDVNHDFAAAPGVGDKRFAPLAMGKGYTISHGSIVSSYLNGIIEVSLFFFFFFFFFLFLIFLSFFPPCQPTRKPHLTRAFPSSVMLWELTREPMRWQECLGRLIQRPPRLGSLFATCTPSRRPATLEMCWPRSTPFTRGSSLFRVKKFFPSLLPLFKFLLFFSFFLCRNEWWKGCPGHRLHHRPLKVGSGSQGRTRCDCLRLNLCG